MAHSSFRTNIKFRRLVHLLKLPAAHVLGICEFVWSVGYESGSASIGDATDIEIAAEWMGEPGALVDALLKCGGTKCGLIEPDPANPSMFIIHNFLKHAPDYVIRRTSREAERHLAKTCIMCRGNFHSPDPRSIYCSDACKQDGYRAGRSKTEKKEEKLPTVTEVVTDPVTKTLPSDRVLPSVTAVSNPTQPNPTQPNPEGSAEGTPPAVGVVKSGESAEAKKARSLNRAPIPNELDTPEFRAAWEKWCKYRREKRQPLTPTGESSMLSKFRDWGVSESIAAIEFTVFKGWQGIQQDPNHGKSNGNARNSGSSNHAGMHETITV